MNEELIRFDIIRAICWNAVADLTGEPITVHSGPVHLSPWEYVLWQNPIT